MTRHFRLGLVRLASLSAVALSIASCGSLESGEAATPQRPTFSSDTNTTADGTLELEAGGAIDRADTVAAPATLKYGAGKRTEIFVGVPVYQRLEVAGARVDGTGDLFAGVRHRFVESEGGTSGAFQLATKLPTANSAFSSGELDFSIAAIVSKTLPGGAGLTGYLQTDFIGNVGEPGTQSQTLAAIAASRPITDRLAGFVEFAQLAIDEDVSPAVATVGIAHAVAPSLILDASLALGLNDDAPPDALQVGLTMNFGRIRSAGTSPKAP